MASKYPQRKIGEDSVSAQGLGCMGMSFSYTSFGGFDNEQSYQVLTKAADMGITLWDTSDVSIPPRVGSDGSRRPLDFEMQHHE